MPEHPRTPRRTPAAAVATPSLPLSAAPDSLARGVLRGNPDFCKLWLGNGLSQFGNRIGLVALPLVAVVTLNATALQVATLTALGTAAFALLGLPAGAWTDRLRRRPVLIASDLGRLVVHASIPLAAAAGVLTIWQLYAVALLAGAGTVFFDVAHQSYLPALVGREHLVDGNARLATNDTAAAAAGPVLGGCLVQWLGAPVAVAVNAVSFAWSAGWLAAIRTAEAPAPRPARRHLAGEVGDGLRLVFGDRVLRALVLSGATWCLFSGVSQAVRMLFLVRDAGLPPGAIGLLLGAGSIGGLVASFGTARLTRWIGDERRALIGYATTAGLSGLLLPLTGPGWRSMFFAAGWTLLMFGLVAYNTVQVSMRQAACPDHLRGRMAATVRTLTWSVTPLGALAGGWLGAGLGPRGAMWVAAAGAVLTPVWLLDRPRRPRGDSRRRGRSRPPRPAVSSPAA